MQIRITAVTHTGTVRQRNEDHYGATGLSSSFADGEVVSAIVSGDRCLAVVADGLGGHPCGDVASRVALEHLLSANPLTSAALVAAVHKANVAIYRSMSRANHSIGMGTTAVAVLVMEQGLAVVNVGDSAAFEFVDDRLVQLTVDDVPDQGALPGLPSSVVTQTLGGQREFEAIQPHLHEDALGSRRRVLLCTDGLTNFVTKDLIGDVLRNKCGSAAAEGLLQLALAAGGRDNVTVILLEPVPA